MFALPQLDKGGASSTGFLVAEFFHPLTKWQQREGEDAPRSHPAKSFRTGIHPSELGS